MARLVKYARSEEERNLSISGQEGTGGEINNGGRREKEREREREREERRRGYYSAPQHE